MTNQKRAALRILIERQTLLKTASPATAREFLIREGIYTPDGALSKSFGGQKQEDQNGAKDRKRA